MHDDGRTSWLHERPGPSGFRPCSGADVRSDGSSVLSVPGSQDDPGKPARLTPSYYLLSGEIPGSAAVCGHSSTTFLHRVIFGVLEGFRDDRRTPDPRAARARSSRAVIGDRRTISAHTFGLRWPPVTKHLGIAMPTPAEGQKTCGRKVIFL